MNASGRLIRLTTRIAFVAYVLLFCLAGMVIAFLAALALFQLSPERLQTAASWRWLAVVLVFAAILVPAMMLVGDGIAVFVLYRFSAERVLELLEPRDLGAGFVSRVRDCVHRAAARLGAPDSLKSNRW